MACVHIAHDCIVGDNVIMSNLATLGGHITIENWSILSGGVLVHQFCKIGQHSFIGAGGYISQDVPPYILAAGSPIEYSGINGVGLKRRGFSKKDIIIAGASAGGHLALYLALAEQNISYKNCLPELKPKGVVNLFGITEVEQTYKYLDKTKFFSLSHYVRRWIPDETRISEVSEQLSPLYIADNQNIKVLTIHGTNDVWVPYSQAELLDKKLKEKHILHTVEGGGHYGFSEEEDQAIREKIKNFITEMQL